MLKKRFAHAMVVLMVVIVAPFATSSAAHAADCYTPTKDPWGVALPFAQVSCSASIYYWTYDSRRHAFTINPWGHPIHTWRTCSTCGYSSPFVDLGGWASDYYYFINYTDPSGRQALEVSVYGTGGTKYCKNYNGNYAGSWYPGATTWTASSSCLAF